MTCARREAGAHRPAASTPPCSPSSGPTPPGDRSRPDPRGGRARLSLVLPVLALLLGALPATPAVAQTVWSTTLTVDRDFGAYGCDTASSQDDCSVALTDNEFTHGGTTFIVEGLYWTSANGDFHIRFTGIYGGSAKSKLAGLTLLVDGVPFAVNDLIESGNSAYWAGTGLDWKDRQRVSLRLTATKNIYGLRLSDFKVTKGGLTRQPDPVDGRVVERTSLGVTWRAANVFERCAYRIDWRYKGTTGRWQFSAKHFTYETRPGVTLPGLYTNQEYEVRVVVLGPKGQPDIEAFRTTVTTTAGTPGGPPEQRGNPPEKSAPPGVSSAQVDGAALTLAFDADLDASAVPPGSAFSVKSTRAEHAVSSVAVSGRTVTLALSPAVAAGDAVTMDYLPPSGPGRLRGPRGDVARISGRAVTNATARAPAQAPLTARFEAAPTEHRGKGKFSLRVAFSAPVSGNADAAAFRVTGGTLERVRRVGRRGDRWALTVKPASHGPVTVALPATTDCAAAGAVCTADGRRLGSALTQTVQGPPGLSVADARAREGEDATLDFAVTLSRAASAPVTVRYRTKNGSARAGRDYTRTSGTLAFAAGETAKTVSVPVLDDAHDEGEETLALTLSRAKGAFIADGEATGTIENDDPMPQAWLARFGRAVADQGVAAVHDRLAADRTPGFRGRIAGEALPDGTAEGAEGTETADGGDPLAAPEFTESERRAFLALLAPGGDGEGDGGAMAAKDAMLGTAFDLMRETDGGLSLGLWGRVARSGFSGREGDLALDGDVTTAMLGSDWQRRDALFGLMLFRSRGEGGHSGPSGSGRVAADLAGVVPWAGLRAEGAPTVWGAAGTGRGDVTLAPEGGAPVTAGLRWTMAAAGAEGAPQEVTALGGARVRWRADALAARTDSEAVRSDAGNLAATRTGTTRLRLGLEASWERRLGSGATLSPRVGIGLRRDGGDAETGYGLEAGGGVRLEDAARGLSVSLDGRALALHEGGDVRDWGLAVSVAWDPRPETRLGPSVVATRGWGGAPTGGVAALLDPEALPGLGGGTDGGDGSLGLEMAWGTDLSGWRHGMTGSAYGRVSGADAEEVRLGWRVAPDAGRGGGGPDHDFWLGRGARDEAGIGAGLKWSAERRRVRSSTGIDLGAREGNGLEAGFRLTREW